MKGPALNMILFITLLLLIDLYVLSGLRGVSKKWRFLQKKWVTLAWLIFSVLQITGLIIVVYVKVGLIIRLIYTVVFFFDLIFKVSFVIFIVADDLRRLGIYLLNRIKKTAPEQQEIQPGPFAIPRSEFLMKAGLLAGTIPLAALKLNMKSGLYDYHVKRHKLYLPNLPKAFDGIKLGQISDIHSGSFYNEKAVLGGVEMLMKEKADIIFFTGDLVNSRSNEMYGYQDIFSKVKAPLGVYSCLGNHDYGDYRDWESKEAKIKDHNDLIACHKNMGWDLLMNSNRRIKVDGEEIGILGVENWGELSRFPKYGRMDLAVKNTDDLPVKLLLSHDPSHWRAQVLPKYPQIDAMFSGHTHGMQLGVQTENFQWSPIEYIYNEWAGFYREGPQQLYVNVGYGFLFPGRVGILPEITIFELKAGTAPHV
ncbi:MAG: metallophosphoesterase [Sphingobacteriales bacterium]